MANVQTSGGGRGPMAIAVSGNNNVVGCCGDGNGSGGNGSGGGKLPDGKQDQLGGSDLNAKCVNGQLVLSWSMAGYVSFKLYKGNQVVEQGGPEKTSYTDSTAEAGKTYTYTLELRKNLVSTDAPEKKQLTASLDNLNCTNDATLKITATCENKKVKLTWTAIEGAYYSLEYTGNKSNLTQTEYVDDSLTSGQTRQYTVRAYRLSDLTAANELASDTATVVYDQVCAPPFEPPADCSDRSKIVTERVNANGIEYTTGSTGQPAVITKTDTVTLQYDCLAVCSVNTWANPFYHSNPSTHGCYQEPPSETNGMSLLSVTINSVVIDSNNKKQVTITWSASRAGRAHPGTLRCERLVQVSYIRATTP